MPENDSPWRVLYVEDDPNFIDEVRELLLQESLDPIQPEIGTTVIAERSFEDAEARLSDSRFDLMVLDVRAEAREGSIEVEDAGRSLLDRIRERRFVPVIFYTNLPERVRDTESHFIRVVEKSAGFGELMSQIRGVFSTGLPRIHRALGLHFEREERQYMWDFATEHWDDFGSLSTADVGRLLARRLSATLADASLEELSQALGEEGIGGALEAGLIPPARYYLIPPTRDEQLAGDIFLGETPHAGHNGYSVLVSPSCDLVQRKAESALLVRCGLLDDQAEVIQARESGSSKNRKAVQALMQNVRKAGQADRYHFLPAAFLLPGLVLDFQTVDRIAIDELNELDRVASIDSPFIESLLSRFQRYWSRLGTPDLDFQALATGLVGDASE